VNDAASHSNDSIEAGDWMADASAHAEAMKVEGDDDDPLADAWRTTFENKPVWD
jgi:hypothetical protein